MYAITHNGDNQNLYLLSLLFYNMLQVGLLDICLSERMYCNSSKGL